MLLLVLRQQRETQAWLDLNSNLDVNINSFSIPVSSLLIIYKADLLTLWDSE